MRANIRCRCDAALVIGTLPVTDWPLPNSWHHFSVYSSVHVTPDARDVDVIVLGRTVRLQLREILLADGRRELAFCSNYGKPQDFAKLVEFRAECLLLGQYDEDSM